MISVERLKREAEETGFRPESQEKVVLLINLLNAFAADELLGSRLALKGGTALNLFLLGLPRLSVDIDLNYVGAVDLKKMQKERPDVEQLLESICTKQGFRVKRQPTEHAGGKYVLGYTSALGSTQNLQVDVNYMYRIPLFRLDRRDSYKIGSFQAINVQVLHEFELAGGKVSALFGRTASRDLFDTDQLAAIVELDNPDARLACVLYGAMSPKDWRRISIKDIDVDVKELREKLIPLFRQSEIFSVSPSELGQELVESCKRLLQQLLPLSDHELEFITLLREQGKIEASLLTEDPQMQHKIRQHPALKWQASKATSVEKERKPSRRK